MRILIAEDERDLNRLLVKKLTAESYSVDACTNGEEALDCLACARYDAVILDIMMPKIDVYKRQERKGMMRLNLWVCAQISALSQMP